MAKFRTHYDNLKVARNAPDAVIRAAYKALMQKYHPDKYDGDPKEAERIAKVIQASFNILSDPLKRAEHDEWIRQQERKVKEEPEFQDVDDGASSDPFNEQPRGYGQGYHQPPPDPPQNNRKESQPDAAPSIYATFWKRAAAAVLDGIILVLPLASVTTPLYLMFSGTGGEPSEVESQKQALALVLASFYYAILESSSWQATPGKRVMGIKVVDLHGYPISFWRAFGRYWGKLPSAFILGIGYLMAAFTQHKQALHDKMANCLIVDKTASPDDVCKAGPYPEIGVIATIATVFVVTLANPIALSVGIPAYMNAQKQNTVTQEVNKEASKEKLNVQPAVSELAQSTTDQTAAYPSQFKGEKMSLNARNIPLKSAFKVLGDFAGLKMETAESVAVNVDVNFNNAPWDYIFSYLIMERNLLWRQQQDGSVFVWSNADVGNANTVVPASELVKNTSSPATSTDQPAGSEYLLDINTATAEEIALVMIGVGKNKAEAIVRDREANGKFTSVDDLARVNVIGRATVEKNRAKLTAR